MASNYCIVIPYWLLKLVTAVSIAAGVVFLAAYGIWYVHADHVRITEDELEAALGSMKTNVDLRWLHVTDYRGYEGELLPYYGYFTKKDLSVLGSSEPPVSVRYNGPPPGSGYHDAILLVNGAGRGMHEVIWLDGERTDVIPHRTIWENPPGGR